MKAHGSSSVQAVSVEIYKTNVLLYFTLIFIESFSTGSDNTTLKCIQNSLQKNFKHM